MKRHLCLFWHIIGAFSYGIMSEEFITLIILRAGGRTMKKVKKWMLLLLTGILAVPQVSVVGAEELSDGEFSYVESTYSETNDNHEILQFEEEDIYTENDLDDGGALEKGAVQGGDVFVDDFLISSADLVYDNIEEHATIAKAGSVKSNEQALHNYNLLLSDVTRYANVLSYKPNYRRVA